MFGLRAGQDDASFDVGNNHRIRRYLEQGLAQRMHVAIVYAASRFDSCGECSLHRAPI